MAKTRARGYAPAGWLLHLGPKNSDERIADSHELRLLRSLSRYLRTKVLRRAQKRIKIPGDQLLAARPMVDEKARLSVPQLSSAPATTVEGLAARLKVAEQLGVQALLGYLETRVER